MLIMMKNSKHKQYITMKKKSISNNIIAITFVVAILTLGIIKVFAQSESWYYCSVSRSTTTPGCVSFPAGYPSECDSFENGGQGAICQQKTKTYNGCKPSWRPWVSCDPSTCTGSVTYGVKKCDTRHHTLGSTEYLSCDCVSD